MDNKYDQSKVAYETGPKEVNTSPSMPAGEKSFGNGNKMPQDDKPKMMKRHAKHRGRHAEHR
jgi:hypothetical protein